mgnify:CR=1 FL=1
MCLSCHHGSCVGCRQALNRRDFVKRSLASGCGAALAATGGNGTYGWTLVSGALPAGLTLDGNTGVMRSARAPSAAMRLRAGNPPSAP